MNLDNQFAPSKGLGPLLGQLLRPAIGFNRPSDVLKDDDLSAEDKRAILATWASDGCAVEGRPQLRWMIGSDDPVPLDEVLEALERLDGRRRTITSGWPSAKASYHQNPKHHRAE